VCSVHGDVVLYSSFIKISILAKVKKDPKNSNKIPKKQIPFAALYLRGYLTYGIHTKGHKDRLCINLTKITLKKFTGR
jgi:hypothetical protein